MPIFAFDTTRSFASQVIVICRPEYDAESDKGDVTTSKPVGAIETPGSRPIETGGELGTERK